MTRIPWEKDLAEENADVLNVPQSTRRANADGLIVLPTHFIVFWVSGCCRFNNIRKHCKFGWQETFLWWRLRMMMSTLYTCIPSSLEVLLQRTYSLNILNILLLVGWWREVLYSVWSVSESSVSLGKKIWYILSRWCRQTHKKTALSRASVTDTELLKQRKELD
jgi:hypothetical protein